MIYSSKASMTVGVCLHYDMDTYCKKWFLRVHFSNNKD